MKKYQKPGETPDGRGEYIEIGPNGKPVDNARQVTIDSKDGHLPPTQEEGNRWKKIK